MNKNVTGAAMVAEHLITIQGTPVDFAVFYKFDGINCEDLGYPCLVDGISGVLKPIAEPYILHSRLLSVATDRLAADMYYCKGGSILATLSNSSLAVLVAGGSSGVVAPTQLYVANWGKTCSSSASTLTTSSVVVNGSYGALSETTVEGSFTSNVFYKSGKSKAYSLPIEVDADTGYYVALLTLSCGSGRAARL